MRAQSIASMPVTSIKERDARHIGKLFVDAGKMKPEDAVKVLHLHEEKGIRFGDAAIQLGLVNQADVNEVLSRQFDTRYLTPEHCKISREVAAAYEPFSTEVEELRALRAQLVSRGFGNTGTRRSIAIVGCDRSGGRSYLAANLAVTFSQLGQRTVLVDADMRNPRQHELFGVANAEGLSTLLAGRSDLGVIQKIPAMPELSLLTAGPVPPNPADLIARHSLADLMQQLATSYDLVLLDTPALGKNTDACSLAACAGAALVVVHRYRTRVKSLNGLIAALSSTEILGTVLNKC